MTGATTEEAERARSAALVDAERKATELFAEVVDRGLVVPGKTERELSDEIRDLANTLFDVRRFWHKRVVRAGVNTIEPYRANPPDLTIQDDDIVFFDFGPLFDQWEADVGRTYVLGDDPLKHRVADDLPRLWHAGHAHFTSYPGHHRRGAVRLRPRPDHPGGLGTRSDARRPPRRRVPPREDQRRRHRLLHHRRQRPPMRRPDAAGHPCHWILEIHLIEPSGRFGGFYEQLLDLHPTSA